MRRKAFTLVQAAIVLVVMFVLAAILLPVFTPWRGGDRTSNRSQCQSNLKQIGLGIAQYLQDYNEKFSPVGSTQNGWSVALQPYTKSWQIFSCAAAEQNENPATTDYYDNSQFDRKWLAGANAIGVTILAGDGADNSPSNYAIKQIPDAWRQDTSSPLFRHREGANYLFADGHVKWFKPEKITNNSTQKGQPTFRLR